MNLKQQLEKPKAGFLTSFIPVLVTGIHPSKVAPNIAFYCFCRLCGMDLCDEHRDEGGEGIVFNQLTDASIYFEFFFFPIIPTFTIQKNTG